jgi:hypothetical protein
METSLIGKATTTENDRRCGRFEAGEGWETVWKWENKPCQIQN